MDDSKLVQESNLTEW